MSVLTDLSPWTDDVVRTYLTATAQEKDESDKFYDTHLDIDRIETEFLPHYQDEFVTQEQFRDEVTYSSVEEQADDADGVRAFVIRGETGSGKSQLCQWLDYELAGKGEFEGADDRIPIHIKANETNIEEIISKLADPLGEDPEIDQITEKNAAEVAKTIISLLNTSSGQSLNEVDLERIINEGDLESMLTSNIEKYQRGLEADDETDFDPNLISKEDYRDIALKLGTDSLFHENRKVLRAALRDEIHRHFSYILGVEDFQGQLAEYSQRYIDELNKRPVIICEDVTTFSVLKEKLLDQIIQVESASYDIVLGYTTGFEQDDLQDALGDRGEDGPLSYLKDRLEGYLSLTQDGSSHFLNNALSVDLVEKYMNVIKRESGAEIDESVETAFDGLYPFNRGFIQMAYNRLLEDGSPRRTPRVLLQKVVRRVLLSDDPPYEVVSKNPNVDEQVTPIDPGEYPNELQKLATWYGYRDEIREESNEILVHSGVLETFGFETDGDGTVSHEDAEYVIFQPNDAATRILGNSDTSRPSIPPSGDDEFEVPSKPETEVKTETTTSTTTEVTSTTTVTEQVEESRDTDRREDQVNDFLEWIETGDSYPSSDVLRSGAESVLEMWHDPTKLGNTNSSRDPARGIYYTRGEDAPVSIEGPDERDGLSVMLPFGKEHMDLYFELLEVGMNEENELPETATVEQLRSWATNSVVGFRQDMREEIEEKGCLPSELTIEHTVLLGKLLLSNAEFGTTEFDRGAVFDRRVPKQRKYDSPLRKALADESGLRTTLGGLKDRRREIEGLIDGFFLLKKNLVDHERLAPVQTEIRSDPDHFLQLAQQIDTEELDYPSAYNIGTSRSNAGTSVEAFLNAISDYAIELSRLSDEDLESHFESSLEPIQQWHDTNHRIDELGTMLDTLMDSLGTFNETKLERWEKTQRHLNDDETSINLSVFNETVQSFVKLELDSPLKRIELLNEFEASQQRHDAWDVYQTFDEIIEELSEFEVSESSDLKTQIQELKEVAEYESARSDVIEAVNLY